MLRPYQQAGLDQTRKLHATGYKKVLLHMATGAGKTHCFSQAIKLTVKKGNRAIMVVRGRKLVQQASDRLFRESVTHGVLMAGHWNYRPHLPVQCCSIDTLLARKWRPKADLVIFDEAHLFTSEKTIEFMQSYQDAFVMAVTATPYTRKSLRHIADKIVSPTSFKELVEQGYLIPPRYFAPSTPDLTGVKTRQGDFVNSDLDEAMSKSQLIGDIPSNWKKYGEDKPTLCFAVSIKHSKRIVEACNEAGISARHVDANCNEKIRNEAIKDLESGKIKIISNVGIFCTGVDVPSLGTIIMARPTKSYILYVQQIGRGSRPFKGQEYFNVLDHAGNVIRHGFVDDEPDPTIDGQLYFEPNKKVKVCKNCFAVVEKTPCEHCGWAPKVESKPGEIIHVDGDLVEMKRPSIMDRERAKEWMREELPVSLKAGFKIWKVFYDAKQKFGDDAAKGFFSVCKEFGCDPRTASQRDIARIIQAGDLPSVQANDWAGLDNPTGFPFK